VRASPAGSAGAEPRPQMHFWHILCLGNTSGRNNFNDFPDKQLTKFSALHTGMAVGQKEVTAWFQADRRIGGIPYGHIPSHFKPCLQLDKKAYYILWNCAEGTGARTVAVSTGKANCLTAPRWLLVGTRCHLRVTTYARSSIGGKLTAAWTSCVSRRYSNVSEQSCAVATPSDASDICW